MADVFGITVTNPPEGWMLLEVVVLCKALDADGSSAMFTRYSKGLGDFETLGMLTAAAQQVSAEIAEQFEDDEGSG